MNTISQLTPHPAEDSLIAWQFRGQPFQQWPIWVQSSCTLQRGPDGEPELRYIRAGATQIVYLDDWLVKGRDGDVSLYSEDDLRRQFEVRH